MSNHPDLNDLQFYAMVVEHGGFAAAERALGIPKSRLSRRIAQLALGLIAFDHAQFLARHKDAAKKRRKRHVLGITPGTDAYQPAGWRHAGGIEENPATA